MVDGMVPASVAALTKGLEGLCCRDPGGILAFINGNRMNLKPVQPQVFTSQGRGSVRSEPFSLFGSQHDDRVDRDNRVLG